MASEMPPPLPLPPPPLPPPHAVISSLDGSMPKCDMPPRSELEPVETFVSEAIRKCDGEAYKAIVVAIRRREDPPMLHKVLLALRTSGSALHRLTTSSQQHAELLHTLIRLDPFSPPEQTFQEATDLVLFENYGIADAHLHLMLALVSTNSVFLTPVLTTLWKLLTFHADNGHPEPRQQRLHATIASILRICPRGNTDMFPVVSALFPFRTKPVLFLQWYTQQTLLSLQYIPAMKRQVLELLVERALEMDVEIKISDGGQVTIEKDDEENDVMLDPEQQQQQQQPTPKKPVLESVDEMADKLDCIMEALFGYVEAAVEKDPLAAKELFDLLLPVFENVVLATYKSKYVQFLVFLLCGLDPDELYREFSVRLVDMALDPHRTTTRRSAVCYLASFVSRARCVCAETACEAVSALLRWAEAYVAVAVTADQLFYTICQAAFYIMCFRGTEALQYHQEAREYYFQQQQHEEEEEEPYPELEQIDISPPRWEKICGHPLQPLRYCLESVREEFLCVARVYGLLSTELLQSLDTMTTREEENTVTTKTPTRRRRSVSLSMPRRVKKGGVGGLGRGSNPLDSFFPFDPYLLRRSHGFIDPLYRSWEGSVDREEMAPITDLVLQHHNDDDEEEEEEEYGQGIVSHDEATCAMSVSSIASSPNDIRRNRAASIESGGSW